MMDIWKPLDTEFDCWRGSGKKIPFWWRDDDAVAVTPQLERLVELSHRVGCDVHLAVIPDALQDDLPGYVLANKGLHVLTHGFAHVDHSAEGEKKCEFSNGRDRAIVRSELALGREILAARLGERFSPVFVPPWNRFASEFIDFLGDCGYRGLSTFTPRKAKMVADGIEQLNTHVDPIEWHGSRSLANPAEIVDHTVRSLRDRRLGKTDNAEPFGYLTHHLVHDPDIWAFSKEFLLKFVTGPTVLWTAKNLEKDMK